MNAIALSLFFFSSLSFAADKCRILLPGLPEQIQKAFEIYTDPHLLPQVGEPRWREQAVEDGGIQWRLQLPPLAQAAGLAPIKASFVYFPEMQQLKFDFQKGDGWSHEYGSGYAWRLILAHVLAKLPDTVSIRIPIHPNESPERAEIKERLARGKSMKKAFKATLLFEALSEFGFNQVTALNKVPKAKPKADKNSTVEKSQDLATEFVVGRSTAKPKKK